MIHTTNDFFNKIAAEIRQSYFPNEVHGRTDNEKYYKATYTMECFHNGVLNYRTFIGRLAKACNDTTENIHNIAQKYIVSFGSYRYNPKKQNTK